MTRHVFFADGFTSASAPSTSGTVQENYELENDVDGSAANIDGLIFDKNLWKSIFMKFELKRSHVLIGPVDELFRQLIDITCFVNSNNEWEMTLGNYVGDDLINLESIYLGTNPEKICLFIDSDSGQISYRSGFMVGDDHESTVHIAVTRISSV